MAENQITECTVCGKGFPPRPHKANLYCGMDCYRVAQRSGKYKQPAELSKNAAPCCHCGKVVAREKSKRRSGERSKAIYCTRECYDAARSAVIASRQVNCLECGVACDGWNGRKYCSHACKVAHKKPAAKKCVNCGCWFSAVKWMPSRGEFAAVSASKTCSKDCETQWRSNNEDRKTKIGDAFRGSNHPNWQGGKSLLSNTSYRGSSWTKQRDKALKRDGYKCLDCGMTDDESRAIYGRSLDVDHVEPFHNFTNSAAANRLSNLETRCKSCHRKAEAKRVAVQSILPFAVIERDERRKIRVDQA